MPNDIDPTPLSPPRFQPFKLLLLTNTAPRLSKSQEKADMLDVNDNSFGRHAVSLRIGNAR
jgi:hypothetical protein